MATTDYLQPRSTSPRAGHAQRRGFTLVELLVVVAIVAVLIALLLPAIQAARAAARAASCSSKMRQLAIATIRYCDTNRGWFPQTVHQGKNQSWVATLAPFVERVDAIRICPSDPRGEEWLAARGTTYVLNDYLTVPGPDAKLRYQFLKSTARTVLFFEGSDARTVRLENEHAHASLWFSPLNLSRNRVFGELSKDICPDRHEGRAYYAYADGHAEPIDQETVAGWAARGENFAKPQ